MSKQANTSGKTNAKALKTLPHITRSSAAEYLTFVASAGQGGVEALYADENVWLTQKMMGQLYDVNVRTINEHLKKVFADRELQEDSVIRKFRITATDGKSYDTLHYNLSAIVESFTIKGFAMDDERLKNDGSVLTKHYFEEQLQRIREIRLSVSEADAEPQPPKKKGGRDAA